MRLQTPFKDTRSKQRPAICLKSEGEALTLTTIKVGLSAHARDRRVARGINEHDIERIINDPEEVFAEAHEGTPLLGKSY